MKNTEKKYKFAILGGDRRQEIVAEELLRRGCSVRTWGIGEVSGAEVCSSVERAIDRSCVILLPLPATRNKTDLAQKDGDNGSPVKLADIVKLAAFHRCGLIMGGMIPDEIKSLGEERGVEVIDFYLSEDLQLKNALPSAEGSLMLAMEHTDITVSGMNALVCGYGRIGRILCALLSSLGASVTVGARREEVLREAGLLGYETVRLDGDALALADVADRSDVIFNTVPDCIFGEAVLSRMEKKPLYIESASLPGGIDTAKARERGIKLLFAPSLPGKYAPVSAGRYIFETVSDILKEKGVSL